jgi:hypothetical protein
MSKATPLIPGFSVSNYVKSPGRQFINKFTGEVISRRQYDQNRNAGGAQLKSGVSHKQSSQPKVVPTTTQPTTTRQATLKASHTYQPYVSKLSAGQLRYARYRNLLDEYKYTTNDPRSVKAIGQDPAFKQVIKDLHATRPVPNPHGSGYIRVPDNRPDGKRAKALMKIGRRWQELEDDDVDVGDTP